MVFIRERQDTPVRLKSLKDLHWKRGSLESFSESDWRSTPSPTTALSQSPNSVLGHRECVSCKLPIFDLPEIFALGKRWHRDCFHCSQCNKQLSFDNYHEIKGKPYCTSDYENLLYSKCYACSKTIYENPLKIPKDGKTVTYHPLCFSCKKCSEPICHYNYMERNGSFYCEYDYHDLFSPKCKACNLPVKDQKDATIAMGGVFHAEHFVCMECAIPLPGNNFRKVDGQVYCENDYHKKFSPKCDFCFEPIRHRGLRALGKQFHADCCLRCAACSKILKEDNYIQVADKAYCKSDWKKLFAPKCANLDCRRPVSQSLTGESVIALGREFHPTCFVCIECNLILDERSFYEVDNEPYCYQHYHDKTCGDCLKARKEKIEQAKKIMNNPRANSTLSRRSMTPIDLFFRSKSSAF